MKLFPWLALALLFLEIAALSCGEPSPATVTTVHESVVGETGTKFATGKPSAGNSVGCQPTEEDAVSAIGAHERNFRLDPHQAATIVLSLDRNLVFSVQHTEEVTSSSEPLTMRILGPDGQTVDASDAIYGRAAGSFVPKLSGKYVMSLGNAGAGQMAVLLKWTVTAPGGFKPPSAVDLHSQPSHELDKPGLQAGRIIVPAGDARAIIVTIGEGFNAFGYTVSATDIGVPLKLVVRDRQDKLVEIVGVCGVHMGGFVAEQSNVYLLVLDNIEGPADMPVTVLIEKYAASKVPAALP